MSHAARKHSDFSASACARWMNCPGSVELAKKAPPQTFESVYAKEGTDAHECLEFIVKRFMNIDIIFDQALKKWPKEMVHNAVLSAHKIFDLKPSPDAKLHVEQRVKLSHIDSKMFGTLDYAWVDLWGELVVIDYKYGARQTVFANDENGNGNPQLMYYASGLAAKHQYEFDRVKLVVIQPRVWNEDGVIHREFTTTIGKLRKFEAEIKEAYLAAKKPNATLKADSSWCKYCPAAPICPEISENQLKKADLFIDETSSEITAAPDVKSLTPETLPKILKACDSLELWIEKVREHAFNIAKTGATIEGYKLVQKRSTRSWLPDAENEAVKMYGDKCYSKQFLSPAQLEKTIGKDAKVFTDKYTSNISSGVTLVPSSDKRIEVKEKDFYF